MTFKEKIDKLLDVNTLGINSIYALEVYVGAGTGAINRYYNSGASPGNKTIKKIKTKFGLSDDQWAAGEFGKRMPVEVSNEMALRLAEKALDTLNRELELNRIEKDKEVARLERDKDKLGKDKDNLERDKDRLHVIITNLTAAINSSATLKQA